MRASGKRRKDIPLLWAVFLVFLLCSVYAGAAYGYGVSDHTEQIPIVKRMLDPSYLANDWFVNESSAFSARYYFALLMAGIAGVIGLPQAYLLVYSVCLVSIALAAYLIAGRLFGSRLTSVISVFFVLFGAQASLGDNWIVVFLLIPTVVANALALFAVYLFMRRRIGPAFLLLGFATLFQLVIGMIVAGMLLAVLFLMKEKDAHKRFVISLACYLPVALLNIVPSVVLLNTGGLSSAQAVDIIGSVRHPWHYIPSQFPLIDYAVFACLAAVFFIHSRKLQKKPRSDDLVRFMLLAAAVLCIVGTVFVEVIPVSAILKLQLFRSTPYVAMFFYMYAADYARRIFERSSLPLVAALAVVLVVALSVSYSIVAASIAIVLWELVLGRHAGRVPGRLLSSRIAEYAALLAAVATVLSVALVPPVQAAALSLLGSFYIKAAGICAIASILFAEAVRPRVGGRLGARAASALLLALVLLTSLPVTVYASGINAARLEADPSAAGVYAWIRASTPEGAVFIISPAVSDFRLAAQRAVVADFKSFPFSDRGALEWMERMNDLTGNAAFLPRGDRGKEVSDGFSSLTREEILTIAEKYGAGYVFLDNRTLSGSGFGLKYTDGRYYVYSVG